MIEDPRLASLERRMVELAQVLEAQRADMQSTVEQLHADLSGDAVRAGAAVDRVVSENERLREAQAELGNRLDAVAERVAPSPGATGDLLHALEARLEELEHARGVEGPVAESTSATVELHQRLDKLEQRIARSRQSDGPRLKRLEDRMEETVGRMTERAEALAAGGEAGDARRTELESRLQQLQDAIDAHGTLAQRNSVTVAQATQRVETVDAEVQAAVSRLTEQLEAQGRALQAAVADGLAEVRASTPVATPPVDAGRLQALDEAVARRDAELEELHDLHAALDAGMGELRSGILAARAADSRTADALDEIYRRIETLSGAQVAAKADQGRGRRSAKKSGESTPDAAALAAVDELAGEQRQLRERIVSLQRTVDEAATASARAASLAAPLTPLRTDVRALHTQLAEQKEALEALAKAVERERRKAPAAAAATAKKVPRASKG